MPTFGMAFPIPFGARLMSNDCHGEAVAASISWLASRALVFACADVARFAKAMHAAIALNSFHTAWPALAANQCHFKMSRTTA